MTIFRLLFLFALGFGFTFGFQGQTWGKHVWLKDGKGQVICAELSTFLSIKTKMKVAADKSLCDQDIRFVWRINKFESKLYCHRKTIHKKIDLGPTEEKYCEAKKQLSNGEVEKFSSYLNEMLRPPSQRQSCPISFENLQTLNRLMAESAPILDKYFVPKLRTKKPHLLQLLEAGRKDEEFRKLVRESKQDKEIYVVKDVLGMPVHIYSANGGKKGPIYYSVNPDRPIGEGSFKSVYEVRNMLGEKFVNFTIKYTPILDGKEKFNAAKAEAGLLKMIKEDPQSVHVVPTFEVFADDKTVSVVQGLMNQGDMVDYINDKFSRMSLTSAPPPEQLQKDLQIAYDLARGVAYLHSKKIVHRDLKPDNVFINDGRAYVGDLGLAFGIEDPATKDSRASFAGTLEYISPAYVKLNQKDRSKFEITKEDDPAACIEMLNDRWSFGIILHTLITGKLPWWITEFMKTKGITRMGGNPKVTKDFLAKLAQWELNQVSYERDIEKNLLAVNQIDPNHPLKPLLIKLFAENNDLSKKSDLEERCYSGKFDPQDIVAYFEQAGGIVDTFSLKRD